MSSKFDTILIRKIAFFLLLLFLGLNDLSAQLIPALSFEIKKPQKLENKKLGSEKTGEKKFTAPRRLMQNTVTKFNWHFNANEKLKEILARAKEAHKDDYNQLLSFYNYSPSQTIKDSVELDSVLYKANAGILLHDLRNSWVDNMYMLMGKAYYFRQTLDTAYLTFQYINYAFSPKEKDGYDKPIGSNANEDGNAFSIATKESKSFSKKVLSRPPSRNESFLWLIRTYITNGEYPEAAGLIETLKHDPNFPERLNAQLSEMQAFWFYEQQLYDSAAFYLERALPQAEGREETARWEFLIGQLYEASRKSEQAAIHYDKAVKHTLNPILEVYARLYSIRQNSGDEKAIDQNIAELLKMVRRDKYTNYRDIIYYSIARMELERNNRDAAKASLIRSTLAAQESSADKLQKSRSFYLLGELQYADGKYLLAKNAYDSVLYDTVVTNKELFERRMEVLATIATQDGVIQRQDSLQRIAAMPNAEREAYIRKMVRRLRKLQGLKEEDPVVAVNPTNTNTNNNTAPELFDNSSKGEWYFYNNGLKSKGYTEFKGRWGNRPNVDNWRRITAVNQALQQQQQDKDVIADKARMTADAENDGVISYENLLKKLPLTPEQMTKSNDSIAEAMLIMARSLMDGLEDYQATIKTVTSLLDRFPDTDKKEEALFYLYYSYLKTGQTANAAAVKRDIEKYYKGSVYEKKINTPPGTKGKTKDDVDMSRRYEKIYTLFIEGQFEKALAEKKIADSLYSSNYWTPQLLYIESVYYVKERKDDSAKTVLQEIIQRYPNSVLAIKAENLIDVLGRRMEIEQYLTDLKIERPKEDTVKIVETKPAPVVVRKEPAPTPAKDSSTAKPTAPPTPVVKTTPVIKKDTVAKVPPPPPASKYAANPAAPHYVMIVLTRVDGVFVSEAKNAFNRYNKQNLYNKPIETTNEIVNDSIRVVLMNNFTSADDALAYVEKVRKIASTEIVPWLPAGKYSFTIISQPNLEVFRTEKNTADYLKFLRQTHPGKFE